MDLLHKGLVAMETGFLLLPPREGAEAERASLFCSGCEVEWVIFCTGSCGVEEVRFCFRDGQNMYVCAVEGVVREWVFCSGCEGGGGAVPGVVCVCVCACVCSGICGVEG